MAHRLSKYCKIVSAALLALSSLSSARAQQVGHYLQGTAGLMGSSEAPPGYYVAFIPYFDVVDSVKGPNGGSFGGRNHLTVAAYMAALSAVTKIKFLGADYGFSLVAPVMKQRLTADLLPNVGFGTYGLSDIYFSPLQLAWHKPKADILFAYGFYAPTGDYSSDQFFNTGLGMWTNQFQLGTTYYLDKTKKWNASLLSTWEVHGTKTGTTVQPGPGLTLEYGFGRRFYHYLANVGVAGTYYRKLMLDSGSTLAFHDQENSIGPEISVIAPRAHLSFLVRYEPQFEVRGRATGQLFIASVSFLGTDH